VDLIFWYIIYSRKHIRWAEEVNAELHDGGNEVAPLGPTFGHIVGLISRLVAYFASFFGSTNAS
jgi:hypothetical protein